MIANVFITIGYRPTGAICTLQGVMVYSFLRASWMWTLILSYHLYVLVCKRQLLKIAIWKLHVFVWGITIVLTLLPLSTNRYNTNPGYAEREVCYIDGGTNALYANIWAVVCVVLPLTICTILMLYFAVKIHFIKTNTLEIKNAVKVLRLYPLGLCLLVSE